MKRQLKIALIFLGVFVVILGVIYPLVVTGISQLFFNHQANGSMITQNGQTAGSELIGQTFSDPKYFWGRLSATAVFPDNADASSGSNYAPSNPALLAAVQARINALQAVDPGNNQAIPVDLVTFSGSGLDPDISVAAADYQVTRVARIRGLTEAQVNTLVKQYTTGRELGFLGEPRVNVLELNLALDTLKVISLSSITVTPSAPDNLGVGSTGQFTATGIYSSGSSADISMEVTWASSDNTIATIDSNGLATGIAAGTTDVTAVLSGLTSPAVNLKVIPAAP